MTDTTNNAPPLPPNLTPEQAAYIEHARRLYEVNLRSAERLIARGVPAGAVVSALLGVATAIGNSTCGPRQMRAILMAAADSNPSDEAH